MERERFWRSSRDSPRLFRDERWTREATRFFFFVAFFLVLLALFVVVYSGIPLSFA